MSWLRSSLTHATKLWVSVFGNTVDIETPTYLRIREGVGVHIGYDCLGYGVISFWIAFVFANRGSWKRKLAWMLGGSLVLWFINVLRIGLVLIANNKKWAIPLGWDHHTWFNIVAYGMIFGMMWVYDRTPSAPKRGN